MARVLKPPEPIDIPPGVKSVFLAGSIEMGRAGRWQDDVAAALADLAIVVLNPRRDAWDATWEQTIENAAFREQVEWELEAQERADVVAMYFAPDTKAPVSLLELGLFARTGKLVVCCPHGYWRRGNVDVVCARYGVAQVATLGDLVERVRAELS